MLTTTRSPLGWPPHFISPAAKSTADRCVGPLFDRRTSASVIADTAYDSNDFQHIIAKAAGGRYSVDGPLFSSNHRQCSHAMDVINWATTEAIRLVAAEPGNGETALASRDRTPRGANPPICLFSGPPVCPRQILQITIAPY